MIKGYKFVYSLVDQGVVLYVGCTGNIVSRYKQHINASDRNMTVTKLRAYLDKLIDGCNYPDMNIIAYLPKTDAEILERTLTNQFSLAGQALLNSRNICVNSTSKELLDNVSYKQRLLSIKHKRNNFINIFLERMRL